MPTLIERYCYKHPEGGTVLGAGDDVHALSHAQVCQNQHMEVSNGTPH